MTYQDLLKNMVSGWQIYEKQVLDGDFSAVCWKEGHHETYGTYDLQGTDRLKLCWYLFYYHQDIAEEILVRLFEEECRNLETNSFQGIGTAVKILTVMLPEHHEDLLERARNANFDCFCGYDCEIQLFRKFCKPLEEKDAEDCLLLAYETGEKAFAMQFFEILKKDYPLDSAGNCRHLAIWNDDLDRSQDNEPLFRKILDFAVQSHDANQIISAYWDLIKFYTEQNQPEKAYQEFEILTDFDLSDNYGTNFFRNLLEFAMEWITADIPESEYVWRWAKPHLKREMKNIHGMYGDLYQKAISASQKINSGFSGKIQKQYDLWKKIHKI